MKKYIYLVFVFISLALFSCEGPPGPPGKDGADGADGANGTDGQNGEVACLVCHSTDNMKSIKSQFARSGHYIGEVTLSRETWSGSCVQCHTTEGFIEYSNTGETEGAITEARAWECNHCHTIHETFEATDFALRMTGAVTMADKTTSLDYGRSNLCMNCHQARVTGPADMGGQYIDLNGTPDDGPGGAGDDDEYLVPAGYYYISSTHYGPHHGPQANLLAGTGFAEISGTYSYSAVSSGAHAREDGRCVGCHMGTYDGSDGGHTWKPTFEGCNTASCHGASPIASFNHNNTQTNIQALLDQLEALLVAQGVVDNAGHPVVGVHTVAQSQAFFNWIGLTEDRSVGVHNPAYAEALLNNSIQAID